MNKHRYAKIAFCGIILTAVFWCGWTQAQPANSESEQNSSSEVGRDNPFENFFGNEKSAAQKVSQSPQLVEEKPELFIETVTLKFLDAGNLRTALAGISSKNGSISIDAKSNSLIICDTKENLEKILAQVRKADKTPEQIMIEVVLLDVKLDSDTEIGVNWDFLTTKYNVKLDNDSKIGTTFRQSLGFSDTLAAIGETATTIGDATAWNTTGLGSDFGLITGDIRNVIHMLQEKNNVEVLASPRVMVVSGQKAVIKAVEEIPYQERSDTSQGGSMTSTQFKPVGVTLDVGATLTDDKFILLDVKAKQDVATSISAVSGVPTVDKREIESKLLLENGQILIIGGLRRKTTQTLTEQLPILGDLPIIGFAFKSTDTIQNNSELLVILSPHIYTGEKPSDIEMEKFNEITQRPLLIIPEVIEKKKEEEKEKARIAKEAEKIEKAKKAKEAKKAEEANKKAKTAKNQKSK